MKNLIAIITALTLTVSFTSCGTYEDDFIGSWTLVEVELGGDLVITNLDMKFDIEGDLKSSSAVMIINEDGTVTNSGECVIEQRFLQDGAVVMTEEQLIDHTEEEGYSSSWTVTEDDMFIIDGETASLVGDRLVIPFDTDFDELDFSDIGLDIDIDANITMTIIYEKI